MSFECLAWAIKIGNVTTGEKMVLLALANYCDEERKAFPSISRLEDDCCMKKSSVRRHLISLEKKGLITKCASGTGRRSSVYQLSEGIQIEHPGGSERTPRVSTVNTQGIQKDTPHIEPVIEPVIEPSPQKKKIKKPISEDWRPNEKGMEFAAELGWHGEPLEGQISDFRDYHLREGNKYADWLAAWRTWLRKPWCVPPEKPPDNVIALNPEQEMEYQKMRGRGEYREAEEYRKNVGKVEGS